MTEDVNVAGETETKESAAGSFLEALYGDPFRAETMRTGRYLVIASTICMAVVLFKVRLQSTSLIPLDFGNRVDVLAMLVSLAVLLLLVSFLLRATTDLLRERETAMLVTRYIEDARVKAAHAAAQATEDDIAQGQHDDQDGQFEPDPWWESYYIIKEAADAAVSRAEKRLGIRSLPRKLRHVREILEIGVPIIFAIIALILSRASLGEFTTALVSTLTP